MVGQSSRRVFRGVELEFGVLREFFGECFEESRSFVELRVAWWTECWGVALWTESLRSRVVGEARVRTLRDTDQRRVHVQARAQCPTPEGLEEQSRRGTTRSGKS